ncbi:MAG: molybdopterin-guanine dinucleotide biosynthesis protein B [Dehalococcoidia bacterium]
MPPMISIVGRAKSGKTSLLEHLIPELKRRGYRLATIKHSAHGHDLNEKGKDSQRLANAGSDAVMVSSSQGLAMLKNVGKELGAEELSLLMGNDYDLIITEGFKKGKAAKIEVHKPGPDSGLMCHPSELLAVVTDEPLDIPVPQYPRSDVSGLADLIEQSLLPQAGGDELSLFINNAPVPLNPFIEDLMTRVVLAIVSTLKGIGEVASLDIRLRRRQ